VPGRMRGRSTRQRGCACRRPSPLPRPPASAAGYSQALAKECENQGRGTPLASAARASTRQLSAATYGAGLTKRGGSGVWWEAGWDAFDPRSAGAASIALWSGGRYRLRSSSLIEGA
jgi:hypothetical protein